jgi:RNA polymerase sigma-70 factor (ECF subfamily)
MEAYSMQSAWGISAPPRVRLKWLRRLAGLWRLLIQLGEARGGEADEIAPPSEPPNQTAPREVDGAVLRRAQRGDHGAFHEIVNHYEGRLRVLAYHLLRDADQMNDALQDTFVKAWGGLSDFRDEAALGTWLYRICYRVCLDYLRRQKVRPAGVELADEVADTADDFDGLALREQVSAALSGLPVEQRAVLLLVDREGYDYSSVAEALEIPVGTVASRLSLARAAMRRALRPQLAEGGSR